MFMEYNKSGGILGFPGGREMKGFSGSLPAKSGGLASLQK